MARTWTYYQRRTMALLRRAWAFVSDYQAQQQRSPSVREVAAGCGYAKSSTCSTVRLLERLEDLGYISIEPGKKRAIRVLIPLVTQRRKA